MGANGNPKKENATVDKNTKLGNVVPKVNKVLSLA